MPARHLRSVDLPDPLRPTTPKNSPGSTRKETSRSARSSSSLARRSGWSIRSLSVWTRSRGMRKVFDTPSTRTAGSCCASAALMRAPRVVQQVACGRVSLATEPVPARGGTADRDEPARAATILVIVAAIGCAALLLYLGRDRTFFFDEWNWVQDRSFGGVKTLLEPHNEHVSIFPGAIYRGLLEVFGLSHGWPFRLPGIVAHLACCGFLFVLVRRRAGAAWAAVAAILLLFLGQAWEDLLWGFQVGFLLSVLGGLVAWWALDRGDRTGDIVACAALCVGALSSSLGVPIAVGVGAELLVSRRRGALWIPIVPLALYGLWYLGYGKSAITADGIYHAPGWAVDAAAAASGSLFGRGLDYGRPLLFVALALVVFGVLRRGVSPRLAGVLVAGAAFWLLTGAARSAGATPTQPESSRYLYLGAVVLLLAGA